MPARCLVASVLLLALSGACRSRFEPSHRDPPTSVPLAAAATVGSVTPAAAALGARELTWVYPETKVGPMHVVVSVPARKSAEERFPLLIAMHGMGESLKGPAAGARGWIDDYWLGRAESRLRAPPLTKADFLGMVEPDRLALLNASLRVKPYGGLVVVCPYTPNRLGGERFFEQALPLADFLVQEVLPRARRELPVDKEPAATAVDGVSLGGRAALLVGLHHPSAFGVVSTLQPAFDPQEVHRIAPLARRAVHDNPRLRFRLVTSSRDYYLASTRLLADDLRRVGIEPHLLVLSGDHSYDFNRGPGVFEMLFFHDRALRGQDVP